MNGYDGEYLENYENGKIKTKAFYKNGLLVGEYREWFDSGKERTVANYDNGKIVGKGLVYFEDGSISEEFVNAFEGNPGYYKKFFNGNILQRKVNVQDGEYEGVYEEYYETGVIAARANYRNGLLHGEGIKFYEDGNTQSISEYKEGKQTAYISFYAHGGIKEKATYDDGGNLLSIDTFDAYGALDTRIPYMDGKINGSVLKFFRNGATALSGTYIDGELLNPMTGYDPEGNEIYKIYYDKNGEVESCMTFSNDNLQHYLDIKDSVISQYEFYPDGSIKFESIGDINGNENRSYYSLSMGQSQPTMTQKFSSNDGLISIFLNLGELNLGCIKSDDKKDYICWNTDLTGKIELIDKEIVLDLLVNTIESGGMKKTDIFPLIDINSADSFFQKNNRLLITEAIVENSAGQKCYNLGFVEYCE